MNHIIWSITSFLGCKYHPGCCIKDEDIPNAEHKRSVWESKKAIMEQEGVLHVMRECEWRQRLRRMPSPKADTRLGRILEIDNEQSCLHAIKTGKIFGFVVADFECPAELIEKWTSHGFLFPPLIRRMDLEERHLSPYMRERFTEEQKSPTTTVVQTYHAKQLFCLTELVKFYLELGYKVSNITAVYQYEPGKALLPFVEKVTKMRCQATMEGDDAKQQTAKLIGNSCKY